MRKWPGVKLEDCQGSWTRDIKVVNSTQLLLDKVEYKILQRRVLHCQDLDVRETLLT